MKEAEKDAWQIMDDWCRRQSEYLGEVSAAKIAKGVALDNPEFRRILGSSQAFGKMRSFIHGAREVDKTPTGAR